MNEEKKCGQPSAFTYYWPGKEASFACLEHAGQIRGLANAMGLYLAMVPCDTETCRQIVKGSPDAK